MTKKKTMKAEVGTQLPLGEDELRAAFQDTWRSLKEAVTKELAKMNAGEVAITASGVTAVTKFLEMTGQVAADQRKAGLVDAVLHSQDLPTFRDDDPFYDRCWDASDDTDWKQGK